MSATTTTTITPQMFLRRDGLAKHSEATFDIETPSPGSESSYLTTGFAGSLSFNSRHSVTSKMKTQEPEKVFAIESTQSAEYCDDFSVQHANSLLEPPTMDGNNEFNYTESNEDGMTLEFNMNNRNNPITNASRCTSEISCTSASFKSYESLQFDFDARKSTSCQTSRHNICDIESNSAVDADGAGTSFCDINSVHESIKEQDNQHCHQPQQEQQQESHESDESLTSFPPKDLNSPPDNNNSIMSNTSSEFSLAGVMRKSPPSSTKVNHNFIANDLNQNQKYLMPQKKQQEGTQQYKPHLKKQEGKTKQNQYPRAISRGRKVQPLVYSAIGSLEKVTQQNLGSFNSKVYLASKLNKKKVTKDKNNFSASSLKPEVRKNNAGTQGQTHLLHDQVKNLHINPQTAQNCNASGTRSQLQASLEQLHDKSDVPQSKIPKKTMHTNQKLKSTLKTTNVKRKKDKKKKVTIDSKTKEVRQIELFRPSCDAYTPRMERKHMKGIKFKPAEERASMENISTTMGTIQKPNFRDALRRVAMIMQQHIVKIEQRFESGAAHLNLFTKAMRDEFAEENFVTPRYKYSMVNLPMGRAGVVYGMRKIRTEYKIPSADDIFEFGHKLFHKVQLSSECSIICLIYVERIMEVAKVPVMAKTWRPIFMCGLLLASKVWQDWASWNIEFASVYPQFSLDAINKLEVKFCKMVKWDLYISTSLYAKYYFALRSLLEKQDFRRRYVQMVGGVNNVAASEAIMISKRSEMIKEKAISNLSLSM